MYCSIHAKFYYININDTTGQLYVRYIPASTLTVHLYEEFRFHTSTSLMLRPRSTLGTYRVYLVNKDGAWGIEPGLQIQQNSLNYLALKCCFSSHAFTKSYILFSLTLNHNLHWQYIYTERFLFTLTLILLFSTKTFKIKIYIKALTVNLSTITHYRNITWNLLYTKLCWNVEQTIFY